MPAPSSSTTSARPWAFRAKQKAKGAEQAPPTHHAGHQGRRDAFRRAGTATERGSDRQVVLDDQRRELGEVGVVVDPGVHHVAAEVGAHHLVVDAPALLA